MKADMFKHFFGKDSTDFSSIAQVDSFVEKKLGHKLEVGYLYPDIASSRGSVLNIEQMDADNVFDTTIKKK